MIVILLDFILATLSAHFNPLEENELGNFSLLLLIVIHRRSESLPSYHCISDQVKYSTICKITVLYILIIEILKAVKIKMMGLTTSMTEWQHSLLLINSQHLAYTSDIFLLD